MQPVLLRRTSLTNAPGDGRTSALGLVCVSYPPVHASRSIFSHGSYLIYMGVQSFQRRYPSKPLPKSQPHRQTQHRHSATPAPAVKPNPITLIIYIFPVPAAVPIRRRTNQSSSSQKSNPRTTTVYKAFDKSRLKYYLSMKNLP